MKSLFFIGPAVIVAASLAQLPIADQHTLRGEASGYWPLLKSVISCKCGCPCECENCKCNCLVCNEWSPSKTGAKACSCCLDCLETCKCSE